MSQLWRDKRTGLLYETHEDIPITFNAQGGGFVCKMPLRGFMQRFEPAEEPTEYRRGWFVIGDDRCIYKGYTRGLKWNGWATPMFSHVNAIKVLMNSGCKLISDSHGRISVDYGDEVVSMDEDEPVVHVAEMIHGQPHYGIGSGWWTWEEIQPRDLAVAFCRQLMDELGPEKYAEMQRLNAGETNPSCCHSHDHCDANQVMLNAFRDAVSDSIDPLDSEDAGDLMEAAWDLARSLGFDME